MCSLMSRITLTLGQTSCTACTSPYARLFKTACRHQQRIFLQRPNAASALAASKSQVMRRFPTTIVAELQVQANDSTRTGSMDVELQNYSVKLAKGQEFVLDAG